MGHPCAGICTGPSPGKSEQAPPPWGHSPHSALLGWAHLSEETSINALRVSTTQPLSSRVPEREPLLTTELHGSHLLVMDPVWRQCEELMRIWEPSQVACAYGQDVVSGCISLFCNIIRAHPAHQTEILDPSGASGPLDDQGRPPFMGTEGISLQVVPAALCWAL